ncbi:uncharacterized protein LOC142823741 [Pelodiscus sinensis]|uniref:uncharacterized protein LOC142823741 n=1 Tax=Pelodiscus sinensis TaxID=13735 RepID=UPI003F6B3FC5
MLLSLCILLLALSPSSQAICSAPGALRAPILNLNPMSARPGDSVLFQCLVSSQIPATHVIFCKDGEEVSSQRVEAKAIYSYKRVVSKDGSGNYTCRYEIKYNSNRVSRSWLSPAKYLRVTGDGSSSSGGADGSSPPVSLSLPLCPRGNVSPSLITVSLLPVVSLRRDQREGAQRDTSNAPEDQIQYASVNLSGSTMKHPRPQREETPTYATIALQKDRRR